MHPITQTLHPANPLLGSGETLEVYFAATHEMAPPRRHAFGIVIYRSSRQEPIEISPEPSFSPKTHAQRGNLGAVITIFDWLDRNQAQGHEVTIYTTERYILDLEASSRKKDSKVKDLYDLIVPRLKDWPLVRFVLLDGLGHMVRRDKAMELARKTLAQLFLPAHKPRRTTGHQDKEAPFSP